jgi:hypothetical protein
MLSVMASKQHYLAGNSNDTKHAATLGTTTTNTQVATSPPVGNSIALKVDDNDISDVFISFESTRQPSPTSLTLLHVPVAAATDLASRLSPDADSSGYDGGESGIRRCHNNEDDDVHSSSGPTPPGGIATSTRKRKSTDDGRDTDDDRHDEGDNNDEVDRLLVVVVDDRGNGSGAATAPRGRASAKSGSLCSSSSLLSNLGDYDDDWNSLLGSVYALPDELNARLPALEFCTAVDRISPATSSPSSSPRNQVSSLAAAAGARRSRGKTTSDARKMAQATAAAVGRSSTFHLRRNCEQGPLSLRQRSASADCRRTNLSRSEAAAVEAVQWVLSTQVPTGSTSSNAGIHNVRSAVDCRRSGSRRRLESAEAEMQMGMGMLPDVSRPFVLTVSERRQLVIFTVDLPQSASLEEDDGTSSPDSDCCRFQS